MEIEEVKKEIKDIKRMRDSYPKNHYVHVYNDGRIAGIEYILNLIVEDVERDG